MFNLLSSNDFLISLATYQGGQTTEIQPLISKYYNFMPKLA